MSFTTLKKILFVSTLSMACSNYVLADNVHKNWDYTQVDNAKQKWGDWDKPDWLRYFGLDAADLNHDGLKDIISGRYVYLQPTNSTQKKWQRIELEDNVDAILTMDIDGDEFADVIAQALPNVYWYEATDKTATSFNRTLIGTIPATSHVNSQGFEKANLFNNKNNEFVIAGNGNIYVFSPQTSNQGKTDWTIKLIAKNTSDEGIGIGDIDHDGDLDIAAGRRPEGEGEPTILVWYENPGQIDQPWKSAYIGQSQHPIDRVEIADLNNDGRSDVIITEERYPGLEPDAQLYWFEQTSDNQWQQHSIVKQYSINNLDIADYDLDGDIDLLTAEHKGKRLELQIWSNNGSGSFSKTVIDTGKENHLGTQWVDMDNDGDLDIIGSGWDQHQFMHFWRNNQVKDQSNNNIKVSQANYQGRTHFVVQTDALKYYYDVAGGGFSRLIDKDGQDWINFKMSPWGDYPAAAASAFRGLPNLVHGNTADSGAGHPGFDKVNSKVVDGNRILSTSKSGDWQWQWTFQQDHAVFEMLKTPANQAYWFLYEGTPGGHYNMHQNYYGTDNGGPLKSKPDFYKNTSDFTPFNWVYLGHKQNDNTLYLAQLNQDKKADLFAFLGNSEKAAASEDGMAIVGFGRGPGNKPLLTGKHQFILGLYPSAIKGLAQHQQISSHIAQQLKEHK